MAVKSVTLKVNVTDGGSTDQLNKKLEKTNQLAEGASKRASMANRAASGARTQGRTEEVFEYDQARSGRGTGAAARDFAQQAQGLGGLVRL